MRTQAAMNPAPCSKGRAREDSTAQSAECISPIRRKRKEPSILRGAPTTGSHIARRAKDERAVQRIQAGKQSGHLGQKWIGEDRRHFLVPKAARIANQLSHIDAQSRRQPLKRAEGGNGLAILDLRNICAWHLHAAGQLALAEVARTADLLHLAGYLQPSFGGGIDGGVFDWNWTWPDRLLDIEWLVAPSAKGVAGPVLDETTFNKSAADNLARLRTIQDSCHDRCAERQSKASAVLGSTTIYVTFV